MHMSTLPSNTTSSCAAHIENRHPDVLPIDGFESKIPDKKVAEPLSPISPIEVDFRDHPLGPISDHFNLVFVAIVYRTCSLQHTKV